MAIKIFNTLTKKEQILTPIEPNHLKMYVCGPTVYDRPHLGNARSAVVYDMFYRFFRQTFKKVTYVRNITDVDDKINAAAKERQISIQALTKEITQFFHADLDALNVMRPTHEPKATEHIPEMVEMIEKLIANKNAYVSDGHVLFDVRSYKDYGALSGRHFDEMISGARVEIADYKKDPLDFVLWKPADVDDDASSVFASPWGKGRPGWHIECSAMSSEYLGETFDIHGGGADLQFPHHENEIAQSKCANPHSHYAKYWIHNGFLTVNGEKMSKSLKNFITVHDLLRENVDGVVIRYLLLASHYRKPLDYSEKSLSDAKKSIEKFYDVFGENLLKKYQPYNSNNSALSNQIIEFLSDDLNVAKVFALLHEKVVEIKNADEKLKFDFINNLNFLGLLDTKYFVKQNSARQNLSVDENYIQAQIALRSKAKQKKNWVLADKIRDDLLQKGVVLEDKAGGEVLWKLG